MKCITKYVALDVHQATTVASVRAAGGLVLARTILPTEEAAVVEFFRGMRGMDAHPQFQIDIEWRDGVLLGVAVRSDGGTVCRLAYGALIRDLELSPGSEVRFSSSLR